MTFIVYSFGAKLSCKTFVQKCDSVDDALFEEEEKRESHKNIKEDVYV